jgi:hypothetical protein
MELEKATITPMGGGDIKVLFNPTQYQLSKANQFAEVAVPGLEAPPLQFVRGNARTLSMQLFFDTYDPVDAELQGSDVRNFTSQITGLLKVDSDSHAPPICLFSWGKLKFIGVLEKADQRFTLFLPNGVPVRATVDVSFKEVGQAQADQARDRFSSDFAKRHVVRRGESLWSIAAERYGDPALWRPIAEENGLDNPLALEAGQVLVIPAL